MKKFYFLLLYLLLFTKIFSCAYYDENISERPSLNSKTIIPLKTIHDEIHSYKTMYNSLYLSGYDRPEVEEFRMMFKKNTYNTLLKDSLENAIELRLFVRKVLQIEGLPPELEYLPVVESYYKTNAKSRSGAIGMWQFMANSVYPFLTLDDFVDERLDPWKETYAAISKLKDNYKMFGDWLIAIAAYNCGAGSMKRALEKAKIKDFWYLYENNLIPQQTKDYIPKLLAIADLSINSAYYESGIPLNAEEYEYFYYETNGIFDYVTVNKPYSLKQLAQELRIDTQTFLYLNPSFIEGYTHPTKESTIRLPFGMKETAENVIQNMIPLEIPFKYKVVEGDTLWGISKKYKVSVQKICELNNISEKAVLSIGKILYIPPK